MFCFKVCRKSGSERTGGTTRLNAKEVGSFTRCRPRRSRNAVWQCCSTRSRGRRNLPGSAGTPPLKMVLQKTCGSPPLRRRRGPISRTRPAWLLGHYRSAPREDSFIRITSLRSLPGLVSGSQRSLTIGYEKWLLTIIVLRSLFLAGRSTDRAPAVRLRLPTNSWMRLFIGSVIRIPDLEPRGRRVKDWRS